MQAHTHAHVLTWTHTNAAFRVFDTLKFAVLSPPTENVQGSHDLSKCEEWEEMLAKEKLVGVP